MLGAGLDHARFWPALGAALLLAGCAFVAHGLVKANVDQAYVIVAAVAAPSALFAWAVWNPAQHRLRTFIVDGAFFAFRIVMWITVVAVAISLPMEGFDVRAWLTGQWEWVVVAAVCWGAQRVLAFQSNRSAFRMQQRSGT